jgi:hypothetical protein
MEGEDAIQKAVGSSQRIVSTGVAFVCSYIDDHLRQFQKSEIIYFFPATVDRKKNASSLPTRTIDQRRMTWRNVGAKGGQHRFVSLNSIDEQ